MKTIDASGNLEYALRFTQTELVIRQMLMDWLPDKIIDCHAHCNLDKHVGEIPDALYQHMMTTFPSLSLEQSRMLKDVFFPGKTVRTLRFASAFQGIDHKSANEYLLTHSDPDDRVALYGVPTEIDYTVSMLGNSRVSALKMYRFYFVPPAETIYQFFPPGVLEEAQSRDIPIILHLPKMIVNCVEDLEKLLADFPRLRIVLAHLGLPHLLVPKLDEVYDYFSNYDNLWMDTSMIPSSEVVSISLEKFGSQRIMYGSDEPLNMVRSTVYDNPQLGQRLITERLYHWVNPAEHNEYRHLANDLTHIHWQALEAIRQAVDYLKLPEDAKEHIFYNTAKEVYGF